jgi:hypothetical protein
MSESGGVNLIKSRTINFETAHYTVCQAVCNTASSLVDSVTFYNTLSSDTLVPVAFFIYKQLMDTFAR